MNSTVSHNRKVVENSGAGGGMLQLTPRGLIKKKRFERGKKPLKITEDWKRGTEENVTQPYFTARRTSWELQRS